MTKRSFITILSCFSAFAVPFIMFFFTRSNSLGFTDAAEFALVTKLASVAHGPGFPSYVLFGWLWSTLTSFFISTHLQRIILFSILSMSSACLIMYLTIYRLLQRVYRDTPLLYLNFIALGTALSFATGFTAWYWASNVEVYAFHVFTFSLLLFGTIEYHHSRKTQYILLAAVGLALGLANHHLTTIAFIPFMLFFLGADMFANAPAKPVSKSKKDKGTKTESSILPFFYTTQFRIFFIATAVITSVFYGWMMIRAGVALPFKFGNPDNPTRLFFHVTGGAYLENTKKYVEGQIGMRFAYFMWLAIRQYGLFALIGGLGVWELLQKKWHRFLIVVAGYFFLLLAYQLRLHQIGDSDAYLLLPFYLLTFTVPFGLIWLIRKKKEMIVAVPLFLLIQLWWNLPLTDKRKFDLSESLMKMLDKSSPKNSVVVLSDWTTVSEYYYYRIVENFRPDLVVLNYDIKFTNYTMLPTLYPDYYKLIQPEYDSFIKLLAAAHPQEIYNTGCSLSTPELFQSYETLIHKINSLSNETRPLLLDPKSFSFFLNQKLFTADGFNLSGCFIARQKNNLENVFIQLPFHWLDMEVVKHEPSACDKIVDTEVMLAYYEMSFQTAGDTANYNTTRTMHQKILALQAEMKENISFLFIPQQQ